jgi:hypothetical protein
LLRRSRLKALKPQSPKAPKPQSPKAAGAWMADAHEDVTVAAVIQLVKGEMKVVG